MNQDTDAVWSFPRVCGLPSPGVRVRPQFSEAQTKSSGRGHGRAGTRGLPRAVGEGSKAIKGSSRLVKDVDPYSTSDRTWSTVQVKETLWDKQNTFRPLSPLIYGWDLRSTRLKFSTKKVNGRHVLHVIIVVEEGPRNTSKLFHSYFYISRVRTCIIRELFKIRVAGEDGNECILLNNQRRTERLT